MTTITSAWNEPSRTLTVINDRAGIHIAIQGDDETRGIYVDRVAFLDAVRTELNVTIIDNTDLPEVTDHGDPGVLCVGAVHWPVGGDIVDDLDREIRARVALLNYLHAHPPVDEAQVEALGELIEAEAVPLRDEKFTDLARRLIATGKVQVQA